MKPLMTYVRTTDDECLGHDYLHVLAWNVDGKGGALVLTESVGARPMQILDVLDMKDGSYARMGGLGLFVCEQDGSGRSPYKPIEPRNIKLLPPEKFGYNPDAGVHPDVPRARRSAKRAR